ncbi:MAG: hypothetical protein HY692_00735 [Cyanobacteria bacterium NC_groundwater_1444_Ag_S-0.65um_54_12]|nr:hypothetical protein [Cyanobacteria bacterium NC_groundwater_1444_Ag_S-0.65um_54_12]
MAEVIVVPHTHWDREWYRPFQSYRLRLVAAMEKIFDLLEKAVLPYFLCDGQTIMLDDYLEICPEQEPLIRQLIKKGRLGIGPWYVLPDEFLVSGEALIRNLLFGQARMRRLGAGKALGYLPDMFGHIAQMPQLLRGFGMEHAIVWRGVDPPAEHFWWQDLSNDGIFTIFLPTGYCNIHLWLPLSATERKQRHAEFLAAHVTAGPYLLLVGCDHLCPNSELPDRVREVGARLGRIEEALPPTTCDNSSLPLVTGELRSPGSAYLLPDVASTRMHLKQANAEVQDLWERVVEPLMALRLLSGFPMGQGFWRQGWELILKNHPHDSICGCSIDEVHQEMMVRFSQARQLGNELADSALDSFAPCQARPGVLIFNPSGWERSGWVELILEVPRSDPMLTDQVTEMATVAGLPPKVQLIGVPSSFMEAIAGEEFYAEIDRFPEQQPVWHCRLFAYLERLAPFGLAYYQLATGPGYLATAPADISWGDNFWENACLRLEICDEQLRLVQKETGTVVKELLRFADSGDAGDEYTFSPPADDRLCQSRLQSWRCLEVTPVHASIELVYVLDVPAELTPDRQKRSSGLVPLRCRTILKLGAGKRFIEGEIYLDNQAKDHRLRILLGTGIEQANQIVSETAFGVMTRQASRGLGNLPVPPGNEALPPTFPHQGFIAVEGTHLATQILAPGLPEAEALDAGAVIAVTLLRCVGWLSREDLRTRGGGAGPALPTREAQMLGPHSFRFAIRFVSPAPAGRQAWWEALADLDHMRHQIRYRSTGGYRLPVARGYQWPEPLLTSQNAAAISALLPAGDGQSIILRAFNPLPEPSYLSINPLPRWSCLPCNLGEETRKEENSCGKIMIKPGTISSFNFLLSG